MRIVRSHLTLLLMLAALLPGTALREEEGEPAARDLALLGKRLLDLGDLGEAFAALRGASETMQRQGPPDLELTDYLSLHLYNLGVRFNNEGDVDRALDCFLEALRLGRMAPGVRDKEFRRGLRGAALSVAGFLVASGRSEKPLQAYGLLDDGSPPDTGRLLGLAAAYLARGEIDQASAAYEQAAALEPASAEVAAGRGRVALRRARSRQLQADGDGTGDLERAVEWLRHAAELEPASASRQRELAGALVVLSDALALAVDPVEAARRSSEAEAAYRKSVELEPGSPWARLDLAGYLMALRRHEEAVSEYERADRELLALIAARPQDRSATAWRAAGLSCRNGRSTALYNLAVDAVNRAEFAKADLYLNQVCSSSGWEKTCGSFREIARARQAAFQKRVALHERALDADPARTADLLALGDLYAGVGAYDKALKFYQLLEANRAEVPGLADRIAAVVDPGPLIQIRKRVEVPAGRVHLEFFRERIGADLETAVKAAWLRVTASLGQDALRGDLAITVHPNKRSFRERAGYRVGGMVKGSYRPGHVSAFETPSHTVLEWVSVLTHEMTHHAVERLSGGRSPRWLSEGLARYVEGDAAVVDRSRLRWRLEASALQPLNRLNEVMEHSWNEPEVFLDARDQALLAVEEMARRRGMTGLIEILVSLRAPSQEIGESVRRALGAGLDQIDTAWRSALKQAGS